jgi:YD repeat-containing protein
MTIVYDDADRELTVSHAQGQSTVTMRFDSNGIKIAQTTTGPNSTTTEAIAVRTTATVCR